MQTSLPHSWLAVIFVLTFVVNFGLWNSSLPQTDTELWIQAATQTLSHSINILTSPTPAHPGTTIVFPTALLIAFHLTSTHAFSIVMSLLMAWIITTLVQQTAIIRPKSWWWIATLILLIPNHLYLVMTPPSTVAALLFALYIVIVFRIREATLNNQLFIALGVCGGTLLATRIDVGAAIIVLAFPYLWKVGGIRSSISLMVSATTFFFLDPYLWISPINQLHAFAGQVGSNIYTPVGFGLTLSVALLALCAFTMTCFFVYIRPRIISIPHDFLVWLLALSVVVCAAILHSDYHPARYFFPLIIVWELFAPLLLFESIDAIKTSTHLISPRRAKIAILVLLAGIRVVPFIAFVQ